MIKDLSSRIQIIQLLENFGFAGGYNKGLKQIEADVYILLNSDIEVTENWTTPLLQRLNSDAHIGIVTPKIKSYNDKNLFEYAGASGGLLDKFGYAFCRGRIFDSIEEDQGQYDEEFKLAWASGCAFVIRSKLFHGLGGFDDSFFAHYEEIDLCWRLRRTGHHILSIPSSTVYHLGGGTMKYASPQKLYFNFRNSLYMLYKNLSGWVRIKKLLSRLILDGVAAIVFLIEGKFIYIKSILRAHYAFYTNLSRLNKTKISEFERISALRIGATVVDGEYSQSIIYNFFFKNKKRFDELDYYEKD